MRLLPRLAPAPGAIVPPEAEDSAKAKRTGLSPLLALAGLWAMSVAALTGSLLVFSLRFRRRLLASARTAKQSNWLHRWLANNRGAAKRLRVLESDKSPVPMVIGLLRPVLLLPRWLRQLEPDQRDAIVAHELAHVCRHDQLMSLLSLAACVLNFFNPFAWLARRRLVAAREELADRWAIEQAGFSPATVAEALLCVAERQSELSLAALLVGHSASELRRRVGALLAASGNRGRSGVVAARALTACLAALALLSCVVFRPAVGRAEPLGESEVTRFGPSRHGQSESGAGASPAGAEQLGLPAKDGSQRASAFSDRLPAAALKGQTAKAADLHRIRALIYILRYHRPFSRTDQWASAIRELVQIGKPAVPELLCELERTHRNETLRALCFALRAIGDPRAVPALIRAIPKTLLPVRSSYGIAVLDPEVRKFMKKYELDGCYELEFRYDIPPREIFATLEKLTGHRDLPDPEGKTWNMYLTGKPEHDEPKKRLFEECQRRWEAWWSEHWREFVREKDELAWVQEAARGKDLVGEAGVKEFGPLFPTGLNVRLGPVHEVVLDRSDYWDAKSYIDFDTGRTYEYFEGVEPKRVASSDELTLATMLWERRTGVDAGHEGILTGVDLHIWLINNERWDSFEQELRSGRRVDLGTEALGLTASFDYEGLDLKGESTKTFLFTTREGGRGILQVFAPQKNYLPYRLRYRMIETGKRVEAKRPARRKPKRRGTPLGPVVTVELQTPRVGSKSLLDFETGRIYSLPDRFAGKERLLAFDYKRQEQFLSWCRERGVDAAAFMCENEEPVLGGQIHWFGLEGLNLVAAGVLPGSFDTMTVERANELVARNIRPAPVAFMASCLSLPMPHTYVFQTAEGSLGVLQLSERKDQGMVVVRYKLSRSPEGKRRAE